MPSKTKKDFRILFISQFTKEILRATDTYLELKIKHEVSKDKENSAGHLESSQTQKQKKAIKDVIREKFRAEKTSLSHMKTLENKKEIQLNTFKQPNLLSIKSRKQKPQGGAKPFFNIPRTRIEEPSLPETVRHITPEATQEQIDLGKLNPLGKDPLVKTIECDGQGQKIIVTGMMGRKTTPIILNQNEISGIIQRFSETGRIPFQQGFFKAAVGKFLISAIISEQNSRFIIKKISGY